MGGPGGAAGEGEGGSLGRAGQWGIQGKGMMHLPDKKLLPDATSEGAPVKGGVTGSSLQAACNGAPVKGGHCRLPATALLKRGVCQGHRCRLGLQVLVRLLNSKDPR